MNASEELHTRHLAERLSEAEATIAALLADQVDAMIEPVSQTLVLLAGAQRALRESEERYRRIVETTNEGVWQMNARLKTTFMNPRMAQMLGCESDMGVGRSPYEFLDQAGRASLAAHLQQPSADQVELRCIRADGTSVWALLGVTPVFDHAGRSDGWLAMVMDIAERKRAGAFPNPSSALNCGARSCWHWGVLLRQRGDRRWSRAIPCGRRVTPVAFLSWRITR